MAIVAIGEVSQGLVRGTLLYSIRERPQGIVGLVFTGNHWFVLRAYKDSLVDGTPHFSWEWCINRNNIKEPSK